MKSKFSKLNLDKKTIAKLDEKQISSVKGGRGIADDEEVTCRDGGITCVGTTTVNKGS
ncbi:class I lanthipeptide [Sphingobacterium sp. WOUb80]|uniref:class I lanthipeptide n=1 Tax=Sphingobacterium sp. WOUb80 TaxID=3234028 RepID=UPI003CF38CC9